MDAISKAKEFVFLKIYSYEKWQDTAAFNGDRRGSDLYLSQILRYRRLLNVLETNLTLADKLIHEAIHINRLSTSSIGPCWERHLLECFEKK